MDCTGQPGESAPPRIALSVWCQSRPGRWAVAPRRFTSDSRAFGSAGEVFSAEFPMVVFDVPSGTDFAALKQLLVRGQDEGWWHFEVSSGTEAFWSA